MNIGSTIQHKILLYCFRIIGKKNGRKFRIEVRKFSQKKDKNEKFYIVEVEALVTNSEP